MDEVELVILCLNGGGFCTTFDLSSVFCWDFHYFQMAYYLSNLDIVFACTKYPTVCVMSILNTNISMCQMRVIAMACMSHQDCTSTSFLRRLLVLGVLHVIRPQKKMSMSNEATTY